MLSVWFKMEPVWLSGQQVGLTIQWSQIRVQLWSLAGFDLHPLEFKSSATHVIANWFPPASWDF